MGVDEGGAEYFLSYLSDLVFRDLESAYGRMVE